MSRIRVLDIAKELGVETKVVIAKLQEMGVQVKNHFNAISESDAAELKTVIRKTSSSPADNTDKKPAASKIFIRRKADIQQEKEETPPVTEPAQTTSNVKIEAQDAQKDEKKPKHPPLVTAAPLEKQQASDNAPHSPHIEKLASQPVEKKDGEKPTSQEQQPQKKNTEQPTDAQKEKTQTSDFASPRTVDPQAQQQSQGGFRATVVRKANVQEPQGLGSHWDNLRQPSRSYVGSSDSGYQRSGDRRGPSGDDQRYPRRDRFAGDRSGTERPQRHFGGDRPGGEGRFERRPHGGPQSSYDRGPRRGDGEQQGGQRPFSDHRSSGQAYVSSSNYQPRGGAPGHGDSKNQNSSLKSFVMGDSTAAPNKDKEMPSRFRDKDKDKDRRKSFDDDKSKGAANRNRMARREDNFEVEDFHEDINLENDTDVTTVRTMIPNRKKSSGRRSKDMKKQNEAANPTRASKKVIRVDEFITVNDLAGELSQKVTVVIKELMKLGMMATVNQKLDFDTAALVAQEFGFEVQSSTVSIEDILTKNTKKSTEEENALPRPPIITIMGHVDHGKTSLLDAIRQTNVVSAEAGGITQHIGAYQVKHNDRLLTFLDTPGHEAFTSMRSRGAQLTDIVVLVVAADDGVMPQTIEAIAHAKAANVPIVVAINKVDKPEKNIERISSALSEQGVIPEEWGGDSIFVQVSALTKQGLPDLLETLLLQADLLDLRARQEGLAEGIVVEARLDKYRGPIATLIVTKGTLKQHDSVVVGRTSGRVRAMTSSLGEKLKEAPPSTPVELIGLSTVPESGDHFNSVANESVAREAVAYRIEKQRMKEMASVKPVSLDDIFAQMETMQETDKPLELPLVIKGDTHGTLEAIKNSLVKLDSPKVKTKVILAGVGGITETDVTLAHASGAVVVGFNTRPDKIASTNAERSKVKILCYTIIYELIEAIRAEMLGTLPPVKSDKVIGHAEVRNTFVVPKVGTIAGSFINDGKVTRNAHIRILRDGVIIYTGRVGSLKRFKDDTKEVMQGFECGIGIENYNDVKVGDSFEAFVVEETAPTLN